MTWLYLVIIAHLLNAVVFIMDKYFVSGPIPEKNVYAFYESFGSIIWLVLIPFGVFVLPGWDLWLQIMAGVIFSVALIFLYDAIKKQDVSGAAPIVGALTAIFTLVLSSLFLKQLFNNYEILAFIFLVMGTFAAAEIDIGDNNKKARIKKITSAIFAGLLFAVFYVIIKDGFSKYGFVNAFFWTRIGMVVGSGFIFIFGNKNNVIVKAFLQSSRGLKWTFLAAKELAGVAFLLLAIAVFWGNVALINAMNGVQYFFLIILSLIISRIRPNIIKEKYTRHDLAHKLSAVVFVVIGLFLLGFGGR